MEKKILSEEQIKILAKKIFIKRKLKEITLAITGIIALAIIPFITGYFILGEESVFCGPIFTVNHDGNPQFPCEGNFFGRWGIGIFWLIITGCILYIIISAIYLWLKSNWEKSIEEAINLLKK